MGEGDGFGEVGGGGGFGEETGRATDLEGGEGGQWDVFANLEGGLWHGS